MTNDATPRDAVVLANLGTPDAPTPHAVRRYLAEFLHDHRVVDLTRWLWCPLLHFVILPVRGPKVARKYASIWIDGDDGGSPLAVYTRRLARAVQQRMPGVRVVDAMRYGTPHLRDALASLRDEGIERVFVLPLYPQYSTSTTASIGDVALHVERPRVRMLDDYHVEPAWVDAVASSIRESRANDAAPRHLLFSFHGLPQRFVDRGDPYATQCEASAQAIAAALQLPRDAWSLSYQSRFGRERWLEPYAEPTLWALAESGAKTLDVVCPGFATDCLETLEEVALGFTTSLAQRGATMRYIPCLNDTPAHARALAALATQPG